MAELQLPKLETRVRFPSSAPKKSRKHWVCGTFTSLDKGTQPFAVCDG